MSSFTEKITESEGFKRLQRAGRALLGIAEATPLGEERDKEGDFGFRRLTSRSDKELSDFSYDKQIRVAHHLWLSNGMAARIIELFTDFVVGDGFTVKAENEVVQQILDDHLEDPDNEWDERGQFAKAQEFGLFGVMAIKPFVNPRNGHVKIASLDPSWLQEFIPDPHRSGKAVAVKIVTPQRDEQTLQVIRRMDDPFSDEEGLLSGQIFLFFVNRLSFLIKGKGDLFSVADWLDFIDQFLMHTIERMRFMHAFIWDVTLKSSAGDSPQKVKARAREIKKDKPKAGAVRVHGENEKWEAVSPAIGVAEVRDLWDILLTVVLGSLGIPKHWFASGEDTNRATAEQMSKPTLRKLRRRQAEFRSVIEMILQFQLDKAKQVGVLSRAVDDSFKVLPPEISDSDIKVLAETMQLLAQGLNEAVTGALTTSEEARKTFTRLSNLAGAEMEEPKKEQLKAELEARLRSQLDAMGMATDALENNLTGGAPPQPGPKANGTSSPISGPPAVPKPPAVPGAGGSDHVA